MAVPSFTAFIPIVMKILEKGEIRTVREIRSAAADMLALSPEDRAEMLPSGKQGKADNRAGWAIAYLRKAGLIESPTQGKCRITDEGKRAFQEAGMHLDVPYLQRYESFRVFQNSSHTAAEPSAEHPASENSPEDSIDAAVRQSNASLASDLLEAIMGRTPRFFERLVVALLLKMGYGGAFDDAGVVVGQSGDEGIDGVIREDKLGFSNIYIQAKRWDTRTMIGRPEIQKFVGALAGQGAQRGLFITTAQFTKEARNYVRKQAATKVVLVDGDGLTRLMIEYDIGVSTQSAYAIKKIDTDFFDIDNA